MQKSIDNFVSRTNNGLYLIDMPTGTGKTTQAIEYIYSHINNDATFFYITSLNKNVDDAFFKLKEKFEKDNRLNEFDENILRLYANSEKVIENMCKISVGTQDDIARFDSYIQLKKEIETMNKIIKLDPSIKDKLVSEIREKLEPAFRRDVKTYLNDKCNTKREKMNLIKEKHKWLIELYPSILTNYRKVFFISLDKFYLGNDSIIEPSYKFINNKYLMNNAIIFIDEIDSAKNVILSRIVDDSLNNNVDLIKLFLNIYSTLKTKKFPYEMLRASLFDANKRGFKENIIERMKNVFEETFDNFNMQYSLKLSKKDLDKNTFLMIIQL